MRPSPSDSALFEKASQAWESGDLESILPTLTRALPQSSDYRLWHIHGLMLRQLERHEEALESLSRAVELAPDAPNPAHALARSTLEAGLPSVDLYANALRLSPGSPELLLGLSAALVAERRTADAIVGLERSLSFTPYWTAGHALLSKLRWTQGERKGFARSFDEALARLPTNMDLRRNQIITLVHAEHWDDALRAIADGRATVGADVVFDANEATIYSETGRVKQADTIFEQLAGVQDSTIQLRRIRHYLRSGRGREASDAIEPWLQRNQSALFWPYASAAWRMTRDERWEWLEGDPRFVGVYDIADRLPPLNELAAVLRNLHTTRGEPLEQSVRGGTQTDGHLFQRTDPIIVKLREAVREVVAEHVAQLPPADPRHPLLGLPRNRPIRFSGAWSVRLNGEGYHANHVHPFGWLSSALYIALPDAMEKQAGFLVLGEPQAQLKLDLEPTRFVEPKPGRLALFPSWMWHGTRPFQAGERMTVAFDIASPEARTR